MTEVAKSKRKPVAIMGVGNGTEWDEVYSYLNFSSVFHEIVL